MKRVISLTAYNKHSGEVIQNFEGMPVVSGYINDSGKEAFTSVLGYIVTRLFARAKLNSDKRIKDEDIEIRFSFTKEL